MALSLSTALTNAMNSMNRRPIIEILSNAALADIPFDGFYLNKPPFGTTDEDRPNIITHSTGRLILVYRKGTGLRWTYTDTGRVEFNYTDMTAAALGAGTQSFIEASIVERADATVGMIFLTEDASNIYLRWAILTATGSVQSSSLIATYAKTAFYTLKSLYVHRLNDGMYQLVYIKEVYFLPESGGTYSGSVDAIFYLQMTTDGTETTAWFKWKKGEGSWSAPVQCTGAWQNLQEGVQVKFIPGSYWAGQNFQFNVLAAVKATGSIWITSNAEDGDQVTVGSVTYTFRTSFYNGGSPNEVKVDPLGMEISLQDLMCAINDETFEGYGEGIRYGTGTVENPDVDCLSRNPDYYLNLQAVVPGAAGNGLTLTTDGIRLHDSGFSGGADTQVLAMMGDPSDRLYTRETADFTSWPAESLIDIPNIGVRPMEHCSLIQVDSLETYLLFNYMDGDSWYNLYYLLRKLGEGWGVRDAVKITAYDSASASGMHPMIIQKTAGQGHLIFHERRGAVHMSNDDPTWCYKGISPPTITDVHFDTVNRNLYAVSCYTWIGNKRLHCVVQIDVDTWAITNCWGCGTTPHFNQAFCDSHVSLGRTHGDYWIVPMGIINTDEQIHIAILDGEASTISNFNFYDWPAYGLDKNVAWDAIKDQGAGYYQLKATWYDATLSLVYLLLSKTYTYNPILHVIGMSLTGEVHTVAFYNALSAIEAIGLGEGDWYIDAENSRLIVSSFNTTSNWKGALFIFTLQGGLVKKMTVDNTPSFPYRGLKCLTVVGNKLYAGFGYEPLYGQADRRGMVEIDLQTYAIQYHRPDWATLDDYGFQKMTSTEDGMVIASTAGYGITIFDPADSSWILHSNDTLPGLTPEGDDYFFPLAYDEEGGLIFTGIADSIHTNWQGVMAFSRYGLLRRIYYQIGDHLEGGGWSFQDPDLMVKGLLDAEGVPALDPDDGLLFLFWTNQRINELSIKWAKESSGFPLHNYLVRGQPLELSWSVDSSPNRLECVVSHGHLFDPFNLSSLLRIYLDKGRKLAVRLGEKVGGGNYWANQGSFVVRERYTSYARGDYPTMKVTAEDERHIWDDMQVIATEYYDGDYPDEIISHLMQNIVDWEAVDIDLTDMQAAAHRPLLYHQWLDKTFKEIIDQLCERMGFFFKISKDDKATAVRLWSGASVNHAYSDKATIVNFTPDDTFSSWINQVMVTGEEIDYTEVLFPEERVASLNGTIGWWRHHRHYRVYYSEDKQRTCRYPRLEVIESVESIGFRLAGGVDQSIAQIDSDDKWVMIEVDAPDLTGALIAAIAALAAALVIFSDWARDAAIVAAIIIIAEILGSIANFQYAIHAQPVGYVRREVKGVANDTALQELIGLVIPQKLVDSLCYSAADCEFVAEHELDLVKMQRRRVSMSKIMDLRDEEGDVIQVPHPYSGAPIRTLITNLTRSITIPEAPGADGACIDKIEGWALED